MCNARSSLRFTLRCNRRLSSIGPFGEPEQCPDLFSAVDKPHKFYMRKSAGDHPNRDRLPGNPPANSRKHRTFAVNPQGEFPGGLERAAERIVLSEYGPAWVIVNENLEILHSHGDTSPYLQLAPGPATFSLPKMARESIRGELRKLLLKAKSEAGPVQSTLVQERDGGEIRPVRWRFVGSRVQRVTAVFSGLVLRPGKRRAGTDQAIRKRTNTPGIEGRSGRSRATQARADADQQRLQSMIDERDAANQDLTSANEEIQSSNEELQSINEELETSKEELQSSNEELNTVNEELRNRNQELSGLSDDLTNLLSSTTMPILMLDYELRIRRVTAAAERLFNFRSVDIGRPIVDIRMRLSVDDLELLVRRVMETLNAEEPELQDLEGRWHLLRVRPYRTADNRIEGAVLALIDIDQIRRAQIEPTRRASLPSRSSNRSKRLFWCCAATCGSGWRIVLSSTRTSLQPAEIENQFFHEIGGEQWNLPGLRTALERLSANQESIAGIRD